MIRRARYVTSIEVAEPPEVNLLTNPCAEVDLTDAAQENLTLTRVGVDVPGSPHGTGFRLWPNTASANSFMTIGGAGAAGFRNGMAEGRTYTASGSLHINAALTGTADARARRIVFVYRKSDGTYVDTYSAQAPNVAGTYRLSVTVTIPLGATEAHIRWYNGHPSPATYVQWHSLRLSEGDNASPNGANILADPGFSEPIGTAWTVFTGTADRWDAEAGAVTGTATGVNTRLVNSASLPVAPGDRFHVSAEVANDSNSAVSVRLACRDAGGALISAPSISVPAGSPLTAYAAVLTVPNTAGIVSAKFEFQIASASTAGTATFRNPGWHRVRDDTEYFDGSLFTDRSVLSLAAAPEYGWDKAKGLSTSTRINSAVVLPDAEFETISVDRFRVPYVEATIRLPYPGPTIEALLDPEQQRDPLLYFHVEHYESTSASGSVPLNPLGSPLNTPTSVLPHGSLNPARGKLWVREVRHDEEADELTITARSGEVVFEDKKRMSTTTIDTGATTPGALWQYALTDAGQIAAYDGIDGYATGVTIPAGDRRLWLQGESLSRLFEEELKATGEPCRSFCSMRGAFSVRQVTQPPASTFANPSYLTTGDAGTVISVESGRSREDGYADATLVQADYTDSTGTARKQWQAYPASGLNRVGQVVQIDRPLPGSFVAEHYPRQAQRRGRRWDITAQADLGVRPGRPIEFTNARTGVTSTIIVDRVNYRIAAGEMDIAGYGQ